MLRTSWPQFGHCGLKSGRFRDDGGAVPGPYRLLTTILDPNIAEATELATAYYQRWEIESTFDELKTHQHGPPW